MRKSKFGDETTFMWEGYIEGRDNVILNPVGSSLTVSDEDGEKIKKIWEEFQKEKGGKAFDGDLYRFEGVEPLENGIKVNLSDLKYSVHNALRHEKGRPLDYYPNPASINAVQETTDGYILLGIKGGISDQRGIGVLGARFIYKGQGSDLWKIVGENVLKETAFHDTDEPFDMSRAAMMGAVFGSNHDTTFAFYWPLTITKGQVSLPDTDEHSGIIFLSTKKSSLEDFLNKENYQGLKVVDHCLGDVELYYRNRHELGNIK